MVELLVLIAGILVFSGFFSGSEAALISITEAEVEDHVHKGKPGSKLLTRVTRRLNRSVIAIVIMNNIVNIVGSILVGQMVISMYGNAMLAVATTALTFGVIVFSDILPKSIGIHYAPTLAPIVAPFIWTITIILYPFVALMEYITSLFHRGERDVGTEAQIRALVKIGRKAGHIESDEGQLIHRAFILNDKTAADVMTPLKDIESLSEGATVSDVAEKVQNSVHSRYPVLGNSIHEIQGIVMRHDILGALAEDKNDTSIRDLMREGLVVKSDTHNDELLLLFRDKHIHLAMVQEDEKTVGLITLEDVLEELVGEIEDETDVED